MGRRGCLATMTSTGSDTADIALGTDRTSAVVIVGHGLSPVGRQWGEAIDRLVVVRMKDPSWQKQEDYGRRLDYLCASAETMDCMLDDKRIPSAYWVQPKKEQTYQWREQSFRARLTGKMKSNPMPPILIMLEHFRKWNALFHACQDVLGHERMRNHSLGMFAITAAAELLKPQSIRLVGFDNMLEPTRTDYWKANKGKWATRHDWMAEHLMLARVKELTGVEIGAMTGACHAA